MDDDGAEVGWVGCEVVGLIVGLPEGVLLGFDEGAELGLAVGELDG